MSGRQGGKLKPLKKAKKTDGSETEEDEKFKQKKLEEEKALKDAKAKLASGCKQPTGGIKKSGKK